jgi:hypothetical protein
MFFVVSYDLLSFRPSLLSFLWVLNKAITPIFGRLVGPVTIGARLGCSIERYILYVTSYLPLRFALKERNLGIVPIMGRIL